MSQIHQHFHGFGHMNQQDCNNFFTIPVAVDLLWSSHWNLKLMIFFRCWTSWSWRGATKVYLESTYRLLSALQVQPPTLYKKGLHSFISRTKIIWQDLKDFNIEIRNINHDLMCNDYPQELVNSIMKPLWSSHSSSDAVDQGTFIIHVLWVCLRNTDALKSFQYQGYFQK